MIAGTVAALRGTLAAVTTAPNRAATDLVGIDHTDPDAPVWRYSPEGGRVMIEHRPEDVTGKEAEFGVRPRDLRAALVGQDPDDKVTLRFETDRVKVTIGQSMFTFDAYPLEPRFQLRPGFGLHPQTFMGAPIGHVLDVNDAAIFAPVLRAASTDDGRPILTGLHLETGDDGRTTAVCCDSYRIIWAPVPAAAMDPGLQWLMPSSSAQLLPKKGPVQILLGSDRARWTDGATTYATELIVGDFPQWRNLVPDERRMSVSLVLPAARMLSTLQRANALAGGELNLPVRFEVEDGEVHVSIKSNDTKASMQEHYAIHTEGGIDKVAFNPQYLASIIRAVGTSAVVMHGINAQKPWVIGNGEGVQALIMPVRVS